MKMVIAVAGAMVAACLTALSAAAGDSPDESYDAKLRAPDAAQFSKSGFGEDGRATARDEWKFNSTFFRSWLKRYA